LIGGATTQLGLFWPNPKGAAAAYATKLLLVNFAFFASQIRLCIFGAKKNKISLKILAAHACNLCEHALKIAL
jgi:hypothetical protein